MAHTDFADYKFTVKEGEASKSGADDAPVWLMCEPITKELDIVGDHGFLGIRLAAGTTIEQAHDFAKLLQGQVTGITYSDMRN